MALARPSDWKKPDYTGALRERQRRIATLKDLGPEEGWGQAFEYYAKNRPIEWIEDWLFTYDPRNLNDKRPAYVPFLLFPRQQELVLWMLDRYERREHGLVEKARDCGLSWVSLAFALYLWTFIPAPSGACDAHAHVLGPYDSFPLAKDRSYESPELPVTEYLRMLDGIGFTRGVVVTASAYGTDNGAMLHALRASPRLRGIAVVDSRTASEEMARMHSLGVRGARFARFPGFEGTVDLDEIDRLAPLLRELGWHAQVWTSLGRFLSVAGHLLEHGLPLVLDHMAIVDVRKGTADAGFQTLLRLLGAGRVWVKLTPYRLSRGVANYEDVRPFQDALVATNPDQLVWGSDWPHVHMTSGMPDDGQLVDLFDDWVPDASLRRKILVDNPARLYGF